MGRLHLAMGRFHLTVGRPHLAIGQLHLAMGRLHFQPHNQWADTIPNNDSQVYLYMTPKIRLPSMF